MEAGKYQDSCAEILFKTKAAGVVLIVLRGERGSGLSVTTTDELLLAGLPDLLRSLADELETEVQKDLEKITATNEPNH